ncbi:hypothetical protein GCM10022214_12800 [Actinomadura miaoliensis]|uniref:DUF3618 domain-containing protein n=2 Tax=Thermomonosporaceae TaxID=2012 RepID=A0ABP7V7M4_9ACTN
MQEACRQGALLCRQGASGATERIVPAARQTRDIAAERVLVAREWSAPRLEQAAGYVETGLAPRVSSFLTEVAHRVEPPRRHRRGRNAALMTVAGVAAVGVAGALLTRRGVTRSAMDELSGSQSQHQSSSDGQVHTS